MLSIISFTVLSITNIKSADHCEQLHTTRAYLASNILIKTHWSVDVKINEKCGLFRGVYSGKSDWPVLTKKWVLLEKPAKAVMNLDIKIAKIPGGNRDSPG